MKRTLRIASILLLLATAVAVYAVAVIGTGEKFSAPALDEGQVSYLTPAAAATLAMYSPDIPAQEHYAEDAQRAYRGLMRGYGRSRPGLALDASPRSRTTAPEG